MPGASAIGALATRPMMIVKMPDASAVAKNAPLVENPAPNGVPAFRITPLRTMM
jgi:hypothetical protein